MEVHLYHHIRYETSVNEKLDQILVLLQRLMAQGAKTMSALDDLKTQVGKTLGVEQSAITLIQGLATQLAAAKTDPVAVQALADQLSAQADTLAAAIAAVPAPPA